MKTIDITPTWEGLLPLLIELAHNATTPEARKAAQTELSRMARAADLFNKDGVKIFRSEEDGGFIALDTVLPGCSAFGDTESHALQELCRARQAMVKARMAAGND